MKRSWKRENLGVRFSSACSIEETGLDSPSFGECMSLLSSHKPRGSWGRIPALHILAQKLAGKNESHLELRARSDDDDPTSAVDEYKKPTVKNLQTEKPNVEESERRVREKTRFRKLHRNISGNRSSLHKRGESLPGELFTRYSRAIVSNEMVDKAESAEETVSHSSQSLVSGHFDGEVQHFSEPLFSKTNEFSSFSLSKSGNLASIGQYEAVGSDAFDINKQNQEEKEKVSQSVHPQGSMAHWTSADQDSNLLPTPATIPENVTEKNSEGMEDSFNAHNCGDQQEQNQDDANSTWGSEVPTSITHEETLSKTAGKSLGARNRWRRLKHTVSFANHLASSSRSSARFIAEDKIREELSPGFSPKEDVGGVGAAIFEGTKTGSRLRAKGRKGMEALLVRQEKSIVNFLQDFYVACLKMPTYHFLAGVFVAPVLLGLFFTPLYIFDLEGLAFEGGSTESRIICPLISATEKCSQYLNVFLYALSLSTTFGGSPVAARSPYCILVANVNTLMAQFLFVFLSGAVFARMSHPSQPIRCSKKAIIRKEDFVPTIGADYKETFRVFAIRLVLTGPLPCELVDAKICLTYRIFVKLPSGSTFCATQDLELVRPEVSYLRYGLMVRHVINRKSPLFGHNMESLMEGDASFTLTVMGLERTSMQPVFHLQDYFACDGDVEWDGDYVDFVETNEKGQRVLNHSKIDSLRNFKVAGVVAQAISRLEAGAQAARHRREEAENKVASSKND